MCTHVYSVRTKVPPYPHKLTIQGATAASINKHNGTIASAHSGHCGLIAANLKGPILPIVAVSQPSIGCGIPQVPSQLQRCR